VVLWAIDLVFVEAVIVSHCNSKARVGVVVKAWICAVELGLASKVPIHHDITSRSELDLRDCTCKLIR
jgi:hypothetical protein